MTKDEALRLALEVLKAAYVPIDLDEQREKAITAIEASLEAKDEPWEEFCDSHCVWTDHHPDCKLAQRTWVGLTEKDICEAAVKSQEGISPRDDTLRFAIAIEAKLKEKNQ